MVGGLLTHVEKAGYSRASLEPRYDYLDTPASRHLATCTACV